MMLRLVLIIVFILSGLPVIAQGENNHWVFGMSMGLDFNSGEPQLLRTKSITVEGSASISDSSGNLLFYTNGSTIWDRNHEIMPNGEGLMGNVGGPATLGSATQGVAIVPFIENRSRYYILTLDCHEGISFFGRPGYLRYSIVDMTLNGGKGDVISDFKNIEVDYGISEKMAIVAGPHCAYWLITHAYGTTEFRTYKIDDAGIHTPAISSFSGSYDNSVYSGPHSWRPSYMTGEMKVSSDNKQIVLVNNSPASIELFDFDENTGKVSGARLVDDAFELSDSVFTGNLYGISFSPDNSKIYIWPNVGALGRHLSPLLQYDLTLLPDMEAVRASRMKVGLNGSFAGMRLGPDQKLYATGYNSNILHRVNYPNLRGDACQVEPLNFSLQTFDAFGINFGLPVTVIKPDGLKTRSRDTTVCSLGIIKFEAPSGFDSYLWSDGSTDKIGHITPPGTIWVASSNACGTVVDTFNVYYNTCGECLFIPDAFTPDGNGLNDVFKVKPLCPIEWFLMRVYNRWGQLVFQSNDVDFGWDGRISNAPVQNDTYYYYILYIREGVPSGIKELKKGAVTLLR